MMGQNESRATYQLIVSIYIQYPLDGLSIGLYTQSKGILNYLNDKTMGYYMTLKYDVAPDVKQTVDELIQTLSFRHIAPKNVYCYRSYGSRSKRIIARIHSLGKIWQQALRHPTAYIIEVLSEQYDSLNQEKKEKTRFSR